MERATRRTRISSFPLSLPRVEGLPRPSCPAPPSSLSSSSPSFSLLLLDSQSNFNSVFFWFLDPLGDRPHPEPRCATMAELKCGKIGPSGVKR